MTNYIYLALAKIEAVNGFGWQPLPGETDRVCKYILSHALLSSQRPVATSTSKWQPAGANDKLPQPDIANSSQYLAAKNYLIYLIRKTEVWNQRWFYETTKFVVLSIFKSVA